MHGMPLRLTLAAALVAAATMVATVPTAFAASNPAGRALVPALPRLVTPGYHSARSAPLSPALTPGPIPQSVPQSPSRSRTLPLPVPALPAAPDAFHITAQQILINQDRASNGGLPALAWSPCLANIALQNAQRIAAQGYLSHTNGPTLDLGCDTNYTHAGENIAYMSGGINDPQANTMFMNSAPHRANILSGNYRFVGTAWVVASNGYGYVAVEFAG